MRERAGRLGLTLAPAALALLVQLAFFPVPPGIWVRGAVIGGLTALVALGMALVYRANRILNFAQGDLGAVPTVLVFVLITSSGWNYFLALTAGLAASLVLGALTELIIIRRFFRAPRLLLTVATIGLSQLLAGSAILLPRLWHTNLSAAKIAPPFHLSFSIAPVIFNANDLIAMVAVPVLGVGLAVLLNRTHVGVAVRAAADSSDRAGMLGVPVKRLQTVVWAIAGMLGFAAIFLRAGILGLPLGPALGFSVLLRALAALMMGRMTNLTGIVAGGVTLGILELGVNWNVDSPLLVDPVIALVIVLALLAHRRAASRAEVSAASSWQAAEEWRSIPPELAPLPEVRAARWGAGAAIASVALVLPHVLSVDRSLKASAVLIYAILGVSVIVLTGWAGQVSLCQVAFFALGAALGGKATAAWHLDLTVALILCAGVGAVAALIVGLPALRLRGLYLAVTTFAFALAAESWLLNPRFFSWIPRDRIPRPALLGRVSIASPTEMYYLALAALVVVLVAMRGIRRSRTGRAFIAVRENERAAAAYGIGSVRTKLTAFAISGGIAAFAGCLFVHHQQAVGVGPYATIENLAVFTMVVVGGVGCLSGAVLGALYFKGSQWFMPADWQFLASGVGALFVLIVAPYGLGGIGSRLQDQALRWVAGRRSIMIPSLTADRADESSRAPSGRAA